MIRSGILAGISALAAAACLSFAPLASAQADDIAGQLRATGQAGEQADGYMGVVADGGDVQARVDQINIKRKAFYTELAAKRGVTVQDVAESTACTLIADRVNAGQFYKLETGGWQKRGDGPTPLPARCPKP
jgi:uncharacterized protein YdbL (DUF1318 family)